jgi:hypothetical protein
VYLLLINSLPKEIQLQPFVYIAFQFSTPFCQNPEHAQESLVGGTAVAIVTFKTDNRIFFRHFLFILITVEKVFKDF